MSASTGFVERLFGNAYLLLLLATLSWAGNAIAGRLAAGAIDPVTLTFLRWFLACAVVAPLAWKQLKADRAIIAGSWPRLVLMGAVGFTAFNLALYGALQYTTALNVSIEQAFMPVAIMLGGYLIYRQRFGLLQAAGVILSILGVLIVASQGAPLAVLELGLNRGDAIMMIAVVLYSSFTLMLRNKPPMHWLSLFAMLAFGGLLVATPLFAVHVLRGGFQWPGVSEWLIVIYTVAFPSLVSQICFVRGVELIGPNRASAFMNLVPIFGAIMAIVILGEEFRLYHLVALMMVLGGIALAERFAHRQ